VHHGIAPALKLWLNVRVEWKRMLIDRIAYLSSPFF
jgi:hypothetical protein